MPVEKGALYAVGISGPTYFASDAVKYATKDARSNLGMAISATVKSVFLGVESTDGSYADTASAVNTTYDYSDTVLNNSEIVETWVDRTGNYSGSAGTTYVLARLDLTKIKLGPPPPKSAQTTGSLAPGAPPLPPASRAVVPNAGSSAPAPAKPVATTPPASSATQAR